MSAAGEDAVAAGAADDVVAEPSVSPVVDVVVVGGGPIGLAATINARMHGLTALVIEPRTGTIDKACGEGVMPGAVTELAALGVHPHGRRIAGISYQDGTHTAEHRFASDAALGVRRTELHRALSERAVELGVEFDHGKVEAIEQGNDGDQGGAVSAHLADGRTIEGRWMLGCDGLHSTVRELVGLAARPRRVGRRDSRRFGIRQHFEVAPWTDLVEVHWAPTAELYVTPVSDTEVGVAVLGPRGTSFEEALASVPALAERLRGAAPASSVRGAGPLLQNTTGQRAGRVLLVGDAAGYVDAITGEGIRLGLAEARAAIECIVAGEPERYEREWRRVTRDFRMLTTGLVAAANSPLRRAIVPFAARLPRVYGRVVESLAR
ncbi:flavin-dependent dehydrogenase [Salinibacterium amurskyense]|uniref:Flavin-dependent dehydrogenase n=1 Tax=Salinibacterium amurskyense TaxID=205941 RepID=A0A2M9D5L9_9MICO|nr:NAD(P)/FAD-dependent oxidoreductase [Salinibacterium amurskyense]PJJ81011.1 flavin-dependent dehydrogenase [Salinibacterium amurskyense]GHD81834.1 oxidoreductase [Salinibacterium amurskyense]